MKQNARKLAYKFLDANRTAALATVDVNNQPDVATVYCVINKDLTIYFTSRVEGRKYINLMRNPSVALSFAKESTLETVLVRGTAQRVDTFSLEQRVLGCLLTEKKTGELRSLPPMQLFDRGYTNEVAILKVTPAEITYAKFSDSSPGQDRPFFQKIL